MIIACPACKTRYVVPDSAIGVEGRTVRCAKCRHSWFQDGALPEAPPAQRPAPQPASPQTVAPQPAAPRPAESAPAPEAAVVQTLASPQRAVVEPQRPPAPQPSVAQPALHRESPPPPLAHDRASTPAAVYAEEAGDIAFDRARSSFDYEPPFRPRRNWARLSTIAAALFAVVSLGLVGAVAWYGLPEWVPFARPTFGEAQTGLVLDFPPNRQDRRTLPNGTEFFGASGSVTNVGSSRRSVPAILVVLRDAHDRIVYSWELVPPKRQLNPGESVSINEAVTDVPKSAKYAEIGWKPG